MAKNNFDNVFKELKKKSSKSSTRFNKAEFDDLTLSMLNSDYSTEVVKRRHDEDVSSKEINVSKDFRNKFIKPILLDAGLDKIEAENLANEYEFKTVDGLYEFISETTTSYMETGKSFRFLPKEDMSAIIKITEKDEYTRDRKTNQTDDKGEPIYSTIEYDKHRVIKSKSSAPKNKKKKVK